MFRAAKLHAMLGLLLVLAPGIAVAQEAQDVAEVSVSPDGAWVRLEGAGADQIGTAHGRVYFLNGAVMDGLLAGAPLEAQFPVVRTSPAVIVLPRPDGVFERFAFVESSVMQPGLQAEFPQIRSYLGQGLDDPGATVRFDVSLLGFGAEVLRPSEDGSAKRSAWTIDELVPGDASRYTTVWRVPRGGPVDWECLTPRSARPADLGMPVRGRGALEVIRNEFVIAVGATGEFSQAVAAQMSPAQAPSVALTMSVINSTINRINLILERDGPVRLYVVNGNAQIVYLDPSTDGYIGVQNDSDGDGRLDWGQMQGENQTKCDNIIGDDNYSLGHVFHAWASGYSGNAGGIGTVCTGIKARAISTGSSIIDTGDPNDPNRPGRYFYIDMVAHEIGHQLGADHTFNGVGGSCGNPNQYASETAYEPGSGSTIMSYGGTCGADDIVSGGPPDGAKLAMYSIASMIQIANTVVEADCVIRVPTGNLHAGDPDSTPTESFVMPAQTPFFVRAAGPVYTQPGEVYTYSVEEIDLTLDRRARPLGPDTGWNEPLFRVLAPSSDQDRWLPDFQSVLNGTSVLGENLPRFNRTAQFWGVVRDNVAGAGGWGIGHVLVQFVWVPSGFRVTAPAGGEERCGGDVIAVVWDPAGTRDAPVNCDTVDILLSTNGGADYPWTLATNFPNAGAVLVPLPFVPTANARIMVRAADNNFYHVNPAPFEVSVAAPTISVQPAPVSVCPNGSFTLSVTSNNGASPRHYQWYWNGLEINGATGSEFHVPYAGNGHSGDYHVVVHNGCGSVTSQVVRVQVGVTIDAQPADQMPDPCGTAVFHVGARGVGTLRYQWTKDGFAIGPDAHVSGVDTATLTIQDVRYPTEGGRNYEGAYVCRVFDDCEVRSSDAATLSLPVPEWVRRSTETAPLYRSLYTTDMAYDDARAVSVLYGGYGRLEGGGENYQGDTWEWDGVEWTRRFPAHSPGRRSDQELVFDPGRGAVLLFGGSGVVPANSEVWAYDGDDWTLLTTSPDGPPPTMGTHGDAAFDTARGKLIVIADGPGVWPSNNTWEMSADLSWQLVSNGPGPDESGAPIAYDPMRSRTVAQTYWITHADGFTWTYTGAGWELVPGANTPRRYWPTLAYDAIRGRVTMYGCCRNLGPGMYATDTYGFDGSQWSMVLPEITQVEDDSLVPAAMVFDRRRRAMVAVGATYNSYWAGEPLHTWEYRYLDAVEFDREPAAETAVRTGDTGVLRVHAAGFGALGYQWRRDGALVTDGATPSGSVIGGAATSTLTITGAQPGDGGTYTCEVTNACGAMTSAGAALEVTAQADFNIDGVVNSQDFFDFLGAFFAAAPAADFNHDGAVNSQDFFDFLNAFFAG